MLLRTVHRLAALLLLLPLAAHAQNTFFGALDTNLHVDAHTSSPAILDPISAEDAQNLGVETVPGDKLFTGDLAFPKGGSLHYKTVVLRHPDGTDLLYLDRNRNGRFEPAERSSFRAIGSQELPSQRTPSEDPLKSTVSTTVDLPGTLFPTCPMQVWLFRDGIPTPAHADQLAVLYTSLPIVQGQAVLPGRSLLVRFEYDPDTQSISLTEGREWVDRNGDGQFDMTPGSGEFLRAHGTAPVFNIGNRTLHVTSVDLQSHRFVLASVSAAADRRIPLTIGAQLPDFTYTDFSGRPRHLSDVKARYVLLDFWATWCAPCMADLPRLKQAYANFHPQGLEILGMNGDESAAKPLAVVQQQNLPWPQARYDADLIEDRFQISVWPTLILIDLSKGQRTILSIGQPDHLPLDGDHLAPTLTTLLAQKP
jgi:thiol-disulfide isomerase/thioredoxin